MNAYKISLFLCFLHFEQTATAQKIVGLLQVRNESAIIEQCLHALSFYTDAIVLVDDASNDQTVNIVRSVAQAYNVEKIICNETSAWLCRTESDNRQKLLDAGRSIGGTHFIVIDADEMVTANCMKNNFLKNMILRLNPGDRLQMNIIHLWRCFDRYRIYFDEKMKYFIFCDDGMCSYQQKFLHVDRVPLNLAGGANLTFDNDKYALIHLGYVHWPNVLARQAWYRCLERVRDPQKSAQEINKWYPAHKEKEATTHKIHDDWLTGYDFFNAKLFEYESVWRISQIHGWIEMFGKDYFSDLEMCEDILK